MSRFPLTVFCLWLGLLLAGAAGAAGAQPASPPATQAQAVQSQSAQAQFPEGAELAEIRFEGVSDPTIERLVRVQLVSRPGVPVSEIDLAAERNRVYNLGTFSQVSLSIEDRPAGPVLFVRVRENPPIREVALRGVSLLDAPQRRQVRDILAQENLIQVGQTYNSTRAEDAVTTLQTIYRQLGFPGAVPVTLEVRPVAAGADTPDAAPVGNETEAATAPVTLEDAGAVRLIYTVDETPPLDTLTFTGATVLTEDELRDIFRPLENLDAFDLPTYAAAAGRVAEAYGERGFRGSGVDPEETALSGGTLGVDLTELTILNLDTTAIGVDPAAFSLEPGDLYNYDTLLADVQRLAEGRSEDIRFEPLPIGDGVQVVFSSGPPASAGPIERIEIAGNTVFTDAELRVQLQLQRGETFTSALATEDFARLLEFYAQEGYLLVPEPGFNFVDGTYVQRVREVKVAGYQVDLQTEDPRTQDEVITRYLPEVGSVYNQAEVEQGVVQIGQLQIVQLGQIGERVSHALIPTDNPARQIVRFIAQEVPSRTITPSAELTTEGGVSFGADIAVSDTNLFGAAHSASASLNAETSDIGFLLGGSLAYTVPWLYLDVLDFQEVATSVSAELFSETLSNQPLTSDGRQRVRLDPDGVDTDDGGDCLADGPDAQDCILIGEYTQRNTGFQLSVGRPIIPNLAANVSARFTQSAYYTEPPEELCDPASPAPNETCSLPQGQAQTYVPQSGFSSFLGATVAYDTRDNPQFAREGYRFTVGGGVGFGNDFGGADGDQRGYTYEQLEVGARTYLTPFENDSHVFAFRFNVGHQFGGPYPASRLFIVGDTNNEATQLRGYRREDINPSQTYAAATAEYRYDFGLSTAVTQTVVGIGFVDLGYVSSVSGFTDYNTPLLGSVGVGVQLNIGFGGGLAIPPLRFDYGFSPTNPTGVFGFRLGFNF